MIWYDNVMMEYENMIDVIVYVMLGGQKEEEWVQKKFIDLYICHMKARKQTLPLFKQNGGSQSSRRYPARENTK